MQSSTAVAFYLPHYHPTPEAGEWWGPGFTDWTTVAQGKRLFPGHHQPHVPADLGFYDQRLGETRTAQATLAARYGIGAFCYFHYWYDGRRLYEATFQHVLESGKPDFPFCLCWVNQPVSRSWDGSGQQVLLKSSYSPQDDEMHFKHLLRAFEDPRYLKKDGRPVFCIQSVKDLPDARATSRRWQSLARAHGLPGIYLVKLETSEDDSGEPEIVGFDAAIDVQPEWKKLAAPGLSEKWRNALRRWGLPCPGLLRHNRMRYAKMMKQAIQRPKAAYTRYPSVCPGWDDSARRDWNGLIVTRGHPKAYEQWLRQLIQRDDPEFVFLNAWNDWANGCHLEPCRRWGTSYLEATHAALSGSSRSVQAQERTRIPVFKPTAAA